MQIANSVKLAATLSIFSFLSAIGGSVAEAAATGSVVGTVKVRGAKDSADVVIYLEGVPGEFPPPEEHAVMDQISLVYTPHVLPIQKGTKVDVVNSDNEIHNVHAYWLKDMTTIFNIAQPFKGQKYSRRLKKEGEVLLLCDRHQEMSAYIIVVPNPFFAKTDKNGSFAISEVPPGEYTLKTWHEKRKPQSQKVTVPANDGVNVSFELKK
jgi:plastocyanin